MSYETEITSKKLALAGLTISALLFSHTGFANKYISSAEEYLSKNETNAAMIELKNAIQKSPEDAIPRYMLGKIYLEQGNFTNAEKELSRALKYGYSAKEALPLLARALLNQNKLDDIFLLVEDFSDTGTTPDLLAITAMAEIKRNNLDEAKTLLKKAGTDTVYGKLAQATYLSTTNQLESASDYVSSLLKSEASNSDVWMLKGHLEIAQNKFDEAYDSYAKAYELSPNARQYIFFMAQALVSGQKLEEAKPLVDNLLTTHSHNIYVNELKAIIAFADQDYSVAKTHADRAIHSGSDSLRVSTISGISAFYLGQFEQAHRVFTKIYPELPKAHVVHRLYIMSQIELGYVDEAIESLNNYDIQSPEESRFISQASIELAKIGRNETALKLAKKAAINDSSQIEATLGLVKLANNDLSGIEDLHSAIEADPSMQDAKRGLSNYYLSRKMFDDANSVADRWLEKQPNDTTALMLKGVINKEKGKIDLAQTYFNQVREIDPNNVQSIVELADIESSNGDTQKALSLLVDAKNLAPNNYKVNTKFLEYSKQIGRLPEAMRTLDEQIKADPLNSHLKVQKAHALVLSDDKKSAINVLESLPHADKDANVLKFLGNLYFSLGKIPEAKRNYQQWVDTDIYNPTAYIRSIQLLGYNNEIDSGLNLAQKAQSVFPSDARFSLIRAELFFKNGDLENAQRTLDAMPEHVRGTAYALELQGAIYIAKQDFSTAVDVYEKSYAAMPNIQNARKLASIYSLNDQNTEAISFLNNIIEQHGEKAEPLKLKLAELQIKSQPEKALAQYEAILAKDPNNALVLNNLAWLYMDKDQTDQACKYAQKAYEIASRSFEIADTYGYCLLKSGDTTRALELLELAYNSRQQNAEIALHFAEALLSNRQITQATKVLSSVVTEDPHLVSRKSLLNEQVKLLAQ